MSAVHFIIVSLGQQIFPGFYLSLFYIVLVTCLIPEAQIPTTGYNELQRDGRSVHFEYLDQVSGTKDGSVCRLPVNFSQGGSITEHVILSYLILGLFTTLLKTEISMVSKVLNG